MDAGRQGRAGNGRASRSGKEFALKFQGMLSWWKACPFLLVGLPDSDQRKWRLTGQGELKKQPNSGLRAKSLTGKKKLQGRFKHNKWKIWLLEPE